jgi:hypothetical protein
LLSVFGHLADQSLQATPPRHACLYHGFRREKV